MFGRNKREIEELRKRLEWQEQRLNALLEHLKLYIGYEFSQPPNLSKIQVFTNVQHGMCLNPPQS
jgi:hypothetical protein